MKHPQLLNAAELEKSPVVANNRMNRERILWGTNSYAGSWVPMIRRDPIIPGSLRWIRITRSNDPGLDSALRGR